MNVKWLSEQLIGQNIWKNKQLKNIWWWTYEFKYVVHVMPRSTITNFTILLN